VAPFRADLPRGRSGVALCYAVHAEFFHDLSEALARYHFSQLRRHYQTRRAENRDSDNPAVRPSGSPFLNHPRDNRRNPAPAVSAAHTCQSSPTVIPNVPGIYIAATKANPGGLLLG
jgi:hypothetical protein